MPAAARLPVTASGTRTVDPRTPAGRWSPDRSEAESRSASDPSAAYRATAARNAPGAGVVDVAPGGAGAPPGPIGAGTVGPSSARSGQAGHHQREVHAVDQHEPR